jgi:hypothetical protein
MKWTIYIGFAKSLIFLGVPNVHECSLTISEHWGTGRIPLRIKHLRCYKLSLDAAWQRVLSVINIYNCRGRRLIASSVPLLLAAALRTVINNVVYVNTVVGEVLVISVYNHRRGRRLIASSALRCPCSSPLL